MKKTLHTESKFGYCVFLIYFVFVFLIRRSHGAYELNNKPSGDNNEPEAGDNNEPEAEDINNDGPEEDFNDDFFNDQDEPGISTNMSDTAVNNTEGENLTGNSNISKPVT